MGEFAEAMFCWALAVFIRHLVPPDEPLSAALEREIEEYHRRNEVGV